MIIQGQESVVAVPKLRYEKRLVRDFRYNNSYKFKLVLTWRLKRLRRTFAL